MIAKLLARLRPQPIAAHPREATGSNMLFIGDEASSPIPEFWNQCLLGEEPDNLYFVGLRPERLPLCLAGTDSVIHVDQPESSCRYNPLATIDHWTTTDYRGFADLLYPKHSGLFSLPCVDVAQKRQHEVISQSVGYILKGLKRNQLCSLPSYLEAIQYPIPDIVERLAPPEINPELSRIGQTMIQSAGWLEKALRTEVAMLRTPWVYWITGPEENGPFPRRVVSKKVTPVSTALLSLYAFSALDFLGRQNRGRLYLDGLETFNVVIPDAAHAPHKGFVRGRADTFSTANRSIRHLLEMGKFPSLVLGKQTNPQGAMTLADVPMLRGQFSYDDLLKLPRNTAIGWMEKQHPHPGRLDHFHSSPAPSAVKTHSPNVEHPCGSLFECDNAISAGSRLITDEILAYATSIQKHILSLFEL